MNSSAVMGDISKGTVAQPICGRSFSRWQVNYAGTVKFEQQSATSHVFEPSISRAPVPQATEFFRQLGATPTRVILEQGMNYLDIDRCFLALKSYHVPVHNYMIAETG
jgi:hypothetical protein